MQGNTSAGSNPRLCLEKNRRNEKFITSLCFFCLGHQGGRRCRITLECKEKVYLFRSGPYAMLFLPSSSCMLFKQMEAFCNTCTIMQPISSLWYGLAL